MKELELFISNSDVSDAFEKSYKGDFNLEDIVKFFTSKNNLDYDFENKSCAIVGSSITASPLGSLLAINTSLSDPINCLNIISFATSKLID